MELRQTLYLTNFSCLSCRAGSVVISCLPFGVIDVSITVGTFVSLSQRFLNLKFSLQCFLAVKFLPQVFIILHVVALVYYIKGILSPKMFKVAVTLVVSVGL